VAAVKVWFILLVDYLVMLGVPVLLVLLVLSALVVPRGAVQTVLLLLIAAGSLVYGAIGIRQAFTHRRKRHETPGR
jgi:hypothetical protein